MKPTKSKQPEQEINIHIPINRKSIGLFFLSLVGIALSVLNFMLIIFIGNIFKVWTLLLSNNPTETYSGFEQLIIIYPIIGEYLIISLTAITIVAMLKDGYDKFKKYDEGNLFGGLIVGLIVGLMGWSLALLLQNQLSHWCLVCMAVFWCSNAFFFVGVSSFHSPLNSSVKPTIKPPIKPTIKPPIRT